MRLGRLKPNERLVVGASVLIYQGDGNLVLYQRDVPVWASGTLAAPGICQMQEDGNLVCYDAAGRPYWASGTAGAMGAVCILQEDGNLVIYDAGGRPIWATQTVLTEAPAPEPPPDADWRPAPEQVRRWSGDFLDALQGFRRPTFMLPGMPVEVQRDVLAQYPGSHVPFGWKTFYPRFPQWTFDWTERVEVFEAVIDRCYQFRRVPVIVVPIEEADSLAVHMRRITPVLERLLRADRVVCLSWGWEINDINAWTANGTQQLEYVRRLRAIVPTPIPLYAHWTPERWSGWPSFDGTEPDKGELDWLREAERIGLTGVLYQEPWDKPVAEIEDRAFRLNQKNYQGPGIKGRVETAGLTFVLFEHSRDPRHYRQVVEICQRHRTGWC